MEEKRIWEKDWTLDHKGLKGGILTILYHNFFLENIAQEK